jgi:hypothetical protein
MQNIDTVGATHKFGEPTNWNEEKDGHCHTLSVRVELHGSRGLIKLVSTWKPSKAELALLNIGGAVELSILAQGQPPVALNVVEPPL